MFFTNMNFCYAQETAGEAKDTTVVAVKKQPDKKSRKDNGFMSAGRLDSLLAIISGLVLNH